MYDYSWRTTFGVGARVRLVRQRKYPEYKLLNLVGTVRTDSGNNVSVIFDTVTNTRSSYGCFYFKAVDLVEAEDDNNNIMEENNNIMEENYNMPKITNYLNVVKISPITDIGTVYHYANFKSDLMAGDLCVVTGLTKIGRSNVLRGLSVAKVVSFEDDFDGEVDGEVVDKIDTSDYDERLRCRLKAAELKSKMEDRAKQLQDIALYQMLAKDDPDMATLLEEYRCICKV